jgi:hypothetical protein
MAKAIDKLTSQMKQQNLLEFLNKSVAEMVETYGCSSYWIRVEVVTGTVIYKLWSIYINQATQGSGLRFSSIFLHVSIFQRCAAVNSH